MSNSAYKGLSAEEELAIVLYLDGNDRSLLDAIARQGSMTRDMKRCRHRNYKATSAPESI